MKAKAVVRTGLAVLMVFCAPAARADAPYEGVLTGTDVYIRSGPGGPGAYPCAKLSAPAKVTVVDKLDDWLKIAPPPGCYSVVTKTYVEVDAATKVGTVTGDNVWVRAAGVLREDNFFSLQTRLGKGDRVKVIGEAGEYYKIDPPAGAYFWVSASYVRRAGAAGAVLPPTTRVVPRTPPAGDVSVTIGPGPGSTTPTTPPEFRVPTTPPTVVSTTQPKQLPPALAEFNAAEKLLIDQCQKPVEQREFDPILARYRAIDVAGNNEYLKPYVDARMAYIQAAIDQKADLLSVRKLVEAVSERERTLKMEQAKIHSEAPTTRPITSYAAQGVLLASDIFPGSPGRPKRYIVRDRHTFFINAYVQCTTGAVSLEAHVGKYVGVVGPTQFDKGLGLDVVEAREIKVLAEDVQFPSPPQPVVKPLPKPVPRPEPPSPAPIVAPTVSPSPAITRPTPLVPRPVPSVEPAPGPTVEPAPAVKPEPAVSIPPKPEPTPVIEPIPVVAPEPLPPPAPTPAVKPEPAVVPAPTPAVEPTPAVKPEPAVVPAVKPEPTPLVRPEPVVIPTPAVTPTPTPSAEPIVRFGPATAPAATQPATQPAVAPSPKTIPPLVLPPATRPVAPVIEEKEYD